MTTPSTGTTDKSQCFNPISSFVFAIVSFMIAPFLGLVYFMQSRIHFISFIRVQSIIKRLQATIHIFSSYIIRVGSSITINYHINFLTYTIEKMLQKTRGTNQRPSTFVKFLRSALVCTLPLTFLMLIMMFFCMSIASILFTSLLVFRSLSATLASYASSFENKMTIFIDEVAALFNFKFLAQIFQPLVNLYSFLSNIINHINFGPVAVQCSGSQAGMELVGNCLIIIIVFIVVEVEYASILLNAKELISNYVHLSLLNRVIHGLDYYFHLAVSLTLYAIFSLFNPVQITVQFLASMVNIEQFYTIDSIVHSYSNYCDNYPGFTNIDIFMAYSCTAVTTLFLIPIIVIMLRLMIPNKLGLLATSKEEGATRLEEDGEEDRVHRIVKPAIDHLRKLRLRALNLYTICRDKVRMIVDRLVVSVQHRVLSLTCLNEKLVFLDEMRKERYNIMLVLIDPYLNYIFLLVSSYCKILTGILTVLSPDIVAIRSFIFWFSKVFRLLEHEEYLDDKEMAAVVTELQAKDAKTDIYSINVVRVTETSREIVDRLTIVDGTFWNLIGRLTDDDENRIAFKADDKLKRESFYELIHQESKELPTTSRLLRNSLNITFNVMKYFLYNNFFNFWIVTVVTLSIESMVYHYEFHSYHYHTYISKKIFNVAIAFYICGILYDIVSLFLLGAQGI